MVLVTLASVFSFVSLVCDSVSVDIRSLHYPCNSSPRTRSKKDIHTILGFLQIISLCIHGRSSVLEGVCKVFKDWDGVRGRVEKEDLFGSK